MAYCIEGLWYKACIASKVRS